MSTLVHDALVRSARSLPSKTALVCEGQRYTYSCLDEMSNRLANAFIARGLRRGDRAAIYLPNSVEAVAGIYAVLKAGAVAVIVNRSTKIDKLCYILANCGAAAMLADETASAEGLIDVALARVPSLRQVLAGGTAFNSAQREFPSVAPASTNIDRDLAFLIYTSGSTGEPKGVMCDHSNVAFAIGSINTYLENTSRDTILNVLPLSFDYGLYQLLMTVTVGATLVLEKSFAYPAEILRRIAVESVTGLPGVPTMFVSLLRLDLDAFDLTSLRYVTNTAAAISPTHLLELRRRLPGVRVFSMYGLTETKRTLYLPPEDLERKPGSVGIAIPGTEVWLQDDDGNRLGPGSSGELVVRGRHVMRGYWEAPQATSERFRPGPYPGEQVCVTGDLFHMDNDGFLYFLSRKDDIIKTRGEKVAPKEVENVIFSLAGVVDAAVVGVPDPLLGEAVKAFVVYAGQPLTRNDVLAHCRAHLEDFMVPKHIEFRRELPRTLSGKTAKRELV